MAQGKISTKTHICALIAGLSLGIGLFYGLHHAAPALAGIVAVVFSIWSIARYRN
jgi:hypothetical protein